MAVFQPAFADLNHLIEPMNAGEMQVARALTQLDDDWSVYVQPRLGTTMPDFVAVHDRHGVCIIEVKDWSCNRYRQTDGGTIEFVMGDGTWQQSTDKPRHQSHRYRTTVYDRFFALPGDNSGPTVAVRSIVVLPQYTTDQARALLQRRQVSDREFEISVWGGDHLTSSVLEMVRGKGCPRPNDQSLARLRRELMQSRVARPADSPMPLSADAKNIATNERNARTRRVRGPAGSGKSFGLATRAAVLASQDKSVLVLTFNVTLANYLRTLVSSSCRTMGANPTRVSCINFHAFCAGVAADAAAAGIKLEEHADLKSHDRLVTRAADAFAAGHKCSFDALLIDEGQDFTLEWWNLLRHNVVTPDGEKLLVADPTQDVYGKQSWTDEERMLGAGFSGPWTELKGSYRMPSDMVPLANEFASRYLSGERLAGETNTNQLELACGSGVTVRRWRNIDRERDLGTSIGHEVVRLLVDYPALSPNDVVFLCDNHDAGLDAVRIVEAAGHPVHHIFAKSEGDRSRRKRRFWPDAPGIKGCTVHSFKGWETEALVMGIGRSEESRRLAYVAMTRIKGPASGAPALLSVVNSDLTIAKFESTFTDWAPPQTHMRVGLPASQRVGLLAT